MIIILTILGLAAVAAGAFIIHPGALLLVSGLAVLRVASTLRSDP